MGALSDLVHQGKVRVIGSSTYPAELIVEAQWVAEQRGRERFRCEQPPYSIFARGIETAVLPTCKKYGMGVIPWSPLAGGWLTGKYRKGDPTPTTGRAARIPDRFNFDLPENQRKLDLVEELLEARGRCRRVVDAPGDGVRARASRRSRRRSSARARWSSSPTCSPVPTCSSATTCSTSIDKLVPPGTNVNAADAGYQPPSLSRSQRRRSRR